MSVFAGTNVAQLMLVNLLGYGTFTGQRSLRNYQDNARMCDLFDFRTGLAEASSSACVICGCFADRDDREFRC